MRSRSRLLLVLTCAALVLGAGATNAGASILIGRTMGKPLFIGQTATGDLAFQFWNEKHDLQWVQVTPGKQPRYFSADAHAGIRTSKCDNTLQSYTLFVEGLVQPSGVDLSSYSRENPFFTMVCEIGKPSGICSCGLSSQRILVAQSVTRTRYDCRQYRRMAFQPVGLHTRTLPAETFSRNTAWLRSARNPSTAFRRCSRTCAGRSLAPAATRATSSNGISRTSSGRSAMAAPASGVRAISTVRRRPISVVTHTLIRGIRTTAGAGVVMSVC